MPKDLIILPLVAAFAIHPFVVVLGALASITSLGLLASAAAGALADDDVAAVGALAVAVAGSAHSCHH